MQCFIKHRNHIQHQHRASELVESVKIYLK